MGKYANVLAGLEREVRGDASSRERIDEIKTKLDGHSSAELANAYGELRLEKAENERLEKDINLRISAVEETLWSKFEDEEITSLKLKNGRTVRVEIAPVAKVIDKAALAQWVRDNGLERLLSLHASTVTSLSNERLLAHEPIPSGVELKTRNTTVYTK